MHILGINPGSHESSACLLRDGEIIAAAEEERFTRLKHATDQMPWYATQFCLKQAGIQLGDIDYVATCWNSPCQLENSVHICTSEEIENHINYYRGQLFPSSHFGDAELPTIAHVSHHLSHASAVYRTCRFDEAALVVIDGQGDTVSTTLGHCVDQGIKILTQFDVSQSLGYFYQAVTFYLGLGWYGGEGKTMGLAAYGVPAYDFPEITLTNEGYRIEAPAPTQKDAADEMISFWLGHLEKRFGDRRRGKREYNLAIGRTEERLAFGDSEENLAASAQAKLEQVVIHLAQLALDLSGSANLLFGGGVALNCTLNEKLLRQTSAEELFVFPATGDSGAAVGAALELAHHLGVSSKVSFDTPFLGPEFSDSSVAELLNEYGIAYQECQDPAQVAVERLLSNQVVAWFQGRMEFGPRALGHRSILANPATTRMGDWVNQYIKRRESWRPLAPALLEEDTASLLGEHLASPYMLRAVPIPEELQTRIPGTVHVDGTARLQTVAEESDPLFYDVISGFSVNSGTPAILNTSLNDTEPIVCSPYDAIRTYSSTALDVLVLNSFVVDAKRVRRRT